jgi:hypothetical protein
VTFRLYSLCVVCAIATLALLTMGAAPKPRVSGVGAAFAIAPDSSVRVTVTVTIRGQLQPGDQIRDKLSKDGAVVVNKVVAALSYTDSLPAPAYGATSCYTASARVVYPNGQQSPEKSSEPWCYTRPELPIPPAEIDSVTVTPAQAALMPADTLRFAAAVFSR